MKEICLVVSFPYFDHFGPCMALHTVDCSSYNQSLVKKMSYRCPQANIWRQFLFLDGCSLLLSSCPKTVQHIFGIPQLTELCIPIKYLYFSLYDILKIIFIHITYDSRIKIYSRLEINQLNKNNI